MEPEPVIVVPQSIVLLDEILVKEPDEIDVLLVIFDQNYHIFIDFFALLPPLLFLFGIARLFCIAFDLFVIFVGPIIEISFLDCIALSGGVLFFRVLKSFEGVWLINFLVHVRLLEVFL